MHRDTEALDMDLEIFKIVRGIEKRNLDCPWKV